RESIDHLERYAGVVGAARARGDHEVRGFQLLRVRHGQRVVAMHDDLGLQHEERLHQVVGERVVIVDQEQPHAHSPSFASSSARRRIALLASTSWYSVAGTLSDTMPAPAWKLYSSPCSTIVRIVMAWSMLPFFAK